MTGWLRDHFSFNFWPMYADGWNIDFKLIGLGLDTCATPGSRYVAIDVALLGMGASLTYWLDGKGAQQ